MPLKMALSFLSLFNLSNAVMKITEPAQNAGDKMLKNKDSIHAEMLQQFQICHFKRKSKISFLVLPQKDISDI